MYYNENRICKFEFKFKTILKLKCRSRTRRQVDIECQKIGEIQFETYPSRRDHSDRTSILEYRLSLSNKCGIAMAL